MNMRARRFVHLLAAECSAMAPESQDRIACLPIQGSEDSGFSGFLLTASFLQRILM
jgi:hypothetical protein